MKIFESAEEAYKHEASIVTNDLVNDPKCYNMRPGGKGGFDHINSKPNRSNPMQNPETARKCSEAGRKTRAKNPGKYKTIAIVNAMKGAAANLGKKRTIETRAKMSAAATGHVCPESTKEAVRKAHLGKIDSLETRRKKSESGRRNAAGKNMGVLARGKKRTIEQREKYKQSKLGIKHPLITCPHCNKIGGRSNMKRWHYDNCKFQRHER